LGGGALAIWHGITAEAEKDFCLWHDTEHMPERLAIPGFLRGRRYRSAAHPRNFFTLYETESVATTRSPPYLARLRDPTPWTRRVLPHFRDAFRVRCRVLETTGDGLGEAILTARLHVKAGCNERLRERLRGPSFGFRRREAGRLAVHLLEPVSERRGFRSALRLLRRLPGTHHQLWILLIECRDIETAETLAGTLPDLSDLLIGGHAQPSVVAGSYALQIRLDRGETGTPSLLSRKR
jgi:hypothetical protein